MNKSLPPIIERPELQTWQQRSLYGLVTLLLWGLWMYLWTPLLSLVAWVLGVRFFVVEMLLPTNMTYVQELFIYGQVILLMLVLILAWSHYNIWRFRGKERRSHQPPLSPADEADWYGIDPKLVEQLRETRSAVVHYDDNNRLVTVQSRASHAPAHNQAEHGKR